MGKLLEEDALRAAMLGLPEWSVSGNEIRRSYTLPSFTGALAFAVAAGHLAERAEHHPDILIQYRKVTLTLSTHSAGGLTNKDVDLAKEIEAIAR